MNYNIFWPINTSLLYFMYFCYKSQISLKEIDKNQKTTSNINYYETFKTFIYSTIITVLHRNGKGRRGNHRWYKIRCCYQS